MRDNSSLYTKVGLFVLITILIFFVGIFIFTGDRKFFEKEYYVKSYFENTSGLLTGAYVKLSGVKIGNVHRIDFPSSTEKNFVEVTLKVNKQGAVRITPDSKATIRTEGLLGASYIEIIRGKQQPFSDISKDMVIESHAPLEFQKLIGNSDELLTNLIKVSNELKTTLVDIQQEGGVLYKLIYDKQLAQELTATISDLSQASNNLKDISKSLREGEGTLGALLIDPSIHDRIKGVLGEAERSRFIRAGVRYLIEKNENEKDDKP